jgi:hypothetical protein
MPFYIQITADKVINILQLFLCKLIQTGNKLNTQVNAMQSVSLMLHPWSIYFLFNHTEILTKNDSILSILIISSHLGLFLKYLWFKSVFYWILKRNLTFRVPLWPQFHTSWILYYLVYLFIYLFIFAVLQKCYIIPLVLITVA